VAVAPLDVTDAAWSAEGVAPERRAVFERERADTETSFRVQHRRLVTFFEDQLQQLVHRYRAPRGEPATLFERGCARLLAQWRRAHSAFQPFDRPLEAAVRALQQQADQAAWALQQRFRTAMTALIAVHRAGLVPAC
jgi:hypothetical protein